jgi:hypothetical protein
MAQEFEQLFKDVFGDQVGKLTTKFGEIAREALKDDFTKLHTEIAELRARLATLERERAEKAADSLEASF